MIQVESLTKYFGFTRALDNLSFEVKEGEVLGFLGPNGAGKTTTMRILTGCIPPTFGTVRIDGIDIRQDSLKARMRIGYMPESVALYKDMTVEAYLRYVAALKRVNSKHLSEHISDVCKKCGIDHVRKRLAGHLSKGYRQRVGLAQALIGRPKVLILDEPTEGLDPKQIIEIRNLIKDLGRENTVILSTHILSEVSMTCQRVIILNKGKLIAVDSPDNLDKNIQRRTVITVGVKHTDGDIGERLRHIPNVVSVQLSSHEEDNTFFYRVETNNDVDIRGRLSEFIIKSGWELIELHRETLSLEDIFVELVTQEEELKQ